MKKLITYRIVCDESFVDAVLYDVMGRLDILEDNCTVSHSISDVHTAPSKSNRIRSQRQKKIIGKRRVRRDIMRFIQTCKLDTDEEILSAMIHIIQNFKVKKTVLLDCISGMFWNGYASSIFISKNAQINRVFKDTVNNGIIIFEPGKNLKEGHGR